MLPIRDLLQIKRHTQTKRKRMGIDIALMDLEYCTEGNRLNKDKYCMISCPCGILRNKIDNNDKSRNKLRDTENNGAKHL